jgi:DNA ligase-4
MVRFRGVDAASITKTCELFADKEFCVMVTSGKVMSKSDVEKKIVEFGGAVVQNPGAETYCIVADKTSLKVRNVIARGSYDVVRVEWLLRCIDQRRLVKWVPSDMIFTTDRTANDFSSDYDRYGDSFYDDTSAPELRKAFDRVPKEVLKPVSASEMAEIELEYFPHDSTSGLFRLCRVMVKEPTTLASIKLRLHGATVVTRLDDSVTHVVLAASCGPSDVSRLLGENRRRPRRFRLVTEDWVEDCVRDGRLVEERSYQPRYDNVLDDFGL